MHGPVRKLSLVVTGAFSAALVLTPLAFAGNGGFAPVSPQSPNADNITDAYWFITGFILFVFVIVESLLVAFVIRYRRGRRARDADGPQIHGSTRLERIWTFGPILILVAIAAFVFVKLPGIKDVPDASAAGERIEVAVVGQQFYWRFTYPNGAIAIDRLRVPVGQPVRLTVTAPDYDVIHSWWIPALGGKIDAIPGRVNHSWFTATKAGVYTGRCAELCGVQHAVMTMTVEAMQPDAFQDWVGTRARQQTSGDAAGTLGREEWVGTCAKCHGLAGEGQIGRAIATSATLQDRAALTNVLRNGFPVPGAQGMPTVGRDWTDEQIDALSAYVKERFGNGG
jgi:cytochrome c oxidase subunit 2